MVIAVLLMAARVDHGSDIIYGDGRFGNVGGEDNLRSTWETDELSLSQ